MTSEDTKENIIAAIIVLAIAIGAGWWIYSHLQAPAEDVRISLPVGGSPTLGAVEAPVAVVMFSDFECPFCGEFERETFPLIKQQYIDTGKVLFVFKQFPLDTHPHALAAAQASLCAHEQGRFWEYHEVLYANQGALTQKELLTYASNLQSNVSLNLTRFTSCMERQPSVALAEKRLGQQSGVSGTPTFFFNGRKVAGALSFEEFAAEVEKELATN